MTMRAAVTSAVPTVGLAGGAIQTAAYTWAAGDLGNCLILNPASAISQALPTPTGSSGNFANGWNASVENVSGNVVTLTVPAGVSLDGVSNGSVKLYPNTGCRFFTDGANWYTTRGLSNGGGVGLKAPGVLGGSGAQATLTGTTTPTALATVTIPPMLDGDALEIACLFDYTASTNSKTVYVSINGVTLLSAVRSSASQTAEYWLINAWKRGTTTARSANASPVQASSSGSAAVGIDLTNGGTLSFMGLLTNTGENIYLNGYHAKLIRP